jgi:uncharacterized protein (TIGR03437 family)
MTLPTEELRFWQRASEALLRRTAGMFGFALLAMVAYPLVAQTVTTLSCSPQTIAAPGSSTCTVGISQGASGGFYVNLLPANGDAMTPQNVLIPLGTSSATFTATVGNVPNDETSTIEAYVNFSTVLFQLSITAQQQITSVSCDTVGLAAGQTSTCTVTANKASGTASVVSLSSNNPLLSIPNTVTLPAGSLTAQFTAVAGAVASSQSATITATWTSANPVSVTTIVRLGPSAPIVTGVSDAADNWSSTSCAAGSWRTIAGGGFASQAAQSKSLTTSLGGVQVMVNGTPAPLSYVSASLVTFQCPSLDAGTPLQVKVSAGSTSLTVPIQAESLVGPAIFVIDAARNDQGLVLNGNSTTLAMPLTAGVASAPASKGSYVSIFATGLGGLQGTNPAVAVNTIRAWIGGVQVKPYFAGAAKSGNGVFQVIAQVSNDVVPGPEVPVYLEVVTPGGAVTPSNQVVIAVN